MPYSIFDNSILNQQPQPNQPPPTRWRYVLLFQITVVVLILFLLWYFFSDYISLNFGDDEKIETITLVGKVEEFNETYFGDINMTSARFLLESRSGKFKENSRKINIKNFNGSIYLKNRTIVLKGTADSLLFGKSSLNIGNETFVLKSLKKTMINLDFDKVDIKFDEGRVRIEKSINYKLDNSTISLGNFNHSLGFDGKFSFIGTADNFTINSPNQNLQINYDKLKEKEPEKKKNKKEITSEPDEEPIDESDLVEAGIRLPKTMMPPINLSKDEFGLS